MSKTVLQVANEIGVPKQRLYRYIKKHISDVHQENGVMYMSDAAETLAKQAFIKAPHQREARHEAHHDVHQSTSLDAVIDVLKTQLTQKDEQIASLTKALENTTAALKDSQALHAGTLQLQLQEQNEKPQKKGWFDVVKGRFKNND